MALLFRTAILVFWTVGVWYLAKFDSDMEFSQKLGDVTRKITVMEYQFSNAERGYASCLVYLEHYKESAEAANSLLAQTKLPDDLNVCVGGQ